MTLPLNIKAVPGAWPLFSKRRASKAFRAKFQQIRKRDRNTCQFCEFQAKDYQEVICSDGNFSNTQDSNLVCACCFCSQCFFIESIGEHGYGGGVVIYLPEMTQNELNSLCHVLFCAIANGTAYRDSAQTIYRALRMRAQQTDALFGEGMSDPATFGQLLVEYQTDRGEIPSAITQNLRLLPSRTSFKSQIQRWAAAALEEFSKSKTAKS